uniref:(northern house mosquito) hypothetical protein n=1 Tax=Culex pipiens TaxID=7175 RepID=A0A8D8BPK5_CULPI
MHLCAEIRFPWINTVRASPPQRSNCVANVKEISLDLTEVVITSSETMELELIFGMVRQIYSLPGQNKRIRVKKNLDAAQILSRIPAPSFSRLEMMIFLFDSCELRH